MRPVWSEMNASEVVVVRGKFKWFYWCDTSRWSSWTVMNRSMVVAIQWITIDDQSNTERSTRASLSFRSTRRWSITTTSCNCCIISKYYHTINITRIRLYLYTSYNSYARFRFHDARPEIVPFMMQLHFVFGFGGFNFASCDSSMHFIAPYSSTHRTRAIDPSRLSAIRAISRT